MKYFGKFGFSTDQVEVGPGVIEDVIVERDYIGDVIQRTEALEVAGSVLPQYRTTTSVSVLSDGVLAESYADLRYISYMGQRWSIASIVAKWPRMEIYFGEVYNGPTPE